MATINNPSRRLEAGSIITFNDGTTTWTLVGLNPGTVKWTRGGYEPLRWMDRATLKDPYQGAQRPGQLSLEVKCSGTVDANDLYTALKTAGSSGNMKLFTVVIKIPDAMGSASTGQQMTFAKCFVKEGGLSYEAGRDFDTLKVEFEHNEVEPTGATY